MYMTMLSSLAAVLYSLLCVQNHFVKRVCAETGIDRCVAAAAVGAAPA